MALLHDGRILPAAKLLYGRLALFCGRDERYQPSQETLAAEICVQPRQVRNLLIQLRNYGYIGWQRTKRGVCRYRILDRQYSATQENQERQCSAAKNGNVVPEGAALECRHKEVYKRGILKEASSSSETVSVAEQNEPTPPAPHALVSENQNRDAWRAIETAICSRVDGGARQRIESSLAAQGFSLTQLAAVLKRYPISRTAKNAVGVLIARAKNLSSELPAIDPDDPEPPHAEEDRKARANREGLTRAISESELKPPRCKPSEPVAEEHYQQQRRYCPQCSGTGYEYIAIEKKGKLQKQTCAKCDGSGKAAA